MFWVLQWSRAQESTEIFGAPRGDRHCLLASMEPRSRERGNRQLSEITRSSADLLQWSRAQESAEIRGQPPDPPERLLALMEPRSRERGNLGLSS